MAKKLHTRETGHFLSGLVLVMEHERSFRYALSSHEGGSTKARVALYNQSRCTINKHKTKQAMCAQKQTECKGR